MVISSAKSFKQPIDYILYEMSLSNLMLYSATLATESKEAKENREKKSEEINGDDPRNNDLISKIIQNG